jgi:perosamine synthetase
VAAVLTVDLYGQCADYARIEAICHRHGVRIVEDAAEALGAVYGERRAGTFGECAVFSFNGNKIITTSGGGMLVSHNPDLVARVRHLSRQARQRAPHYEHEEIGFNYGMSNLLAAVGRGQLQTLPQKLARRRVVNETYRAALDQCPGIAFMPEADYGRSNCWLTCLTVEPSLFGASREQIREHLESHDIESRPVWKPMHQQPVFKGCHVRGGAVADELFEKGLCLPSGSSLTEAEQARVIAAIEESRQARVVVAKPSPEPRGESVPFFRPSLGEPEKNAVRRVLDAGWLTSGREVERFEKEFARSVGSDYAVAVNSATAALHLALDALGLRANEGVLVPTVTFAATAEVVRYCGAVPILVDCDADSLHIDLRDAELKISQATNGTLLDGLGPKKVVGMIPVHVGGLMADLAAIRTFASSHDLWVVEDAAHAFPAAWRAGEGGEWVKCGQQTAEVTCFSFYANKTITTGEGGMAVTGSEARARRMRLMSLHGISKDAWARSSDAAWDYRIIAPGFKYNLTDIAAAIGIQQLARAEQMRITRERLAATYMRELGDLAELDLPVNPPDRVHAWHLFPIRLRLDRLSTDRATFIDALRKRGVATSVHWRPLHLHPYYEESFGWRPEQFPNATMVWPRLVSLPLFPSMADREIAHVIDTVRGVCREYRHVSFLTAS